MIKISSKQILNQVSRCDSFFSNSSIKLKIHCLLLIDYQYDKGYYIHQNNELK